MVSSQRTTEQRFTFTGTWRPFQQRVLDELDQHIADTRFHMVAAPGSGKTVLGLEVIQRLNVPTLVLCPTVAIRDQWIATLRDRFLPEDASFPPWVTTDLREPQFLTVATYQALHAACCGEIDPESGNILEECEQEPSGDEAPSAPIASRAQRIINGFRAAGIRVLAVDEAHHLRASWWVTLNAVKDALDDPMVVALTATPPYDAPEAEWRRYASLCGPIDAEVSIPEMVREGNLCPHQDYLYLNAPSDDELARITEFRRQAAEFFNELAGVNPLAEAVSRHPWLADPKAHIEAILSDPAYCSAMLIYLQHTRLETAPGLTRILGVDEEEVPPLDMEWLEILLNGALYADAENYTACKDYLAICSQQLHRMGAIERRQVKLCGTEQLDRLVSASINKMHSIVNIVRQEMKTLGDALRLVVLTDFIRQEALPSTQFTAQTTPKMGVVPIFDMLRQEIANDELLGALQAEATGDLRCARLGLLSGTLVIIPLTAVETLLACCETFGIATRELIITPLDCDGQYCRVERAGQGCQGLVRLVTELFTRGEINVLVGTCSLLGEGWDAPGANTLILASTVRSYMLSNQLRGRALRRDARIPDKVANIWHLVCVDPTGKQPGGDFVMLKRRFKAFAGLALRRDIIENGLDRLEPGAPPFTSERITTINDMMQAAARERQELAARWKQVLDSGIEPRMVAMYCMHKPAIPRARVFKASLGSLGIEIAAIGAGGLALAMADPPLLGVGIAAAISLLNLSRCVGDTVRAVKHARLESSLQQIGLAVLTTLQQQGMVKTPPNVVQIKVEKDQAGQATCYLAGGTAREQVAFAECMNEVLGPVGNPRYLLVHRRRFGRLTRQDYFTVPEMIGAKREWAATFCRAWRKYVGRMELVFTRSVEGRKVLLQARQQALFRGSGSETGVLSRWK